MNKPLVLFLMCLTSTGFAQLSYVDSLEIELSKKRQIDEEYVDILNHLSFEYLSTDTEKGLELTKRAMLLSDSLSYPKGIFWAQLNQGNAYWITGLFDEALQQFLYTYTLVPPNDLKAKLIICNNIGEVYKKIQQFDSASKYLFIARQIAMEDDLDVSPSMVSSNIAELYYIREELDSAHYYYQESYELAKVDQGDQRGMSYALSGQGDIAFRNGRLDTAILLHKEALEIRMKIGYSRAAIQSNLMLGEIYLAQGAMGESVNYYGNALDLARQSSANDLLVETYVRMSEYYEKNGNYLKANGYLKKSQGLKDSLEVVQYSRQMKNLKLALEADIKDAENKFLRAEQEKNEHSVLNQRYITLGFALITIVMIAFLYQYYIRLKASRRHNKEMGDINELLEAQVRKKTEHLRQINEELSRNLKAKEEISNQLKSSNTFLKESQALARLGTWEYEIESGKLIWSDETYRQLGLEPNSSEPSLELLEEAMGKKRYEELVNGFGEVLESKESVSLSFTIVNTVGDKRVIQLNLAPEVNEMGEVLKIVGSNQDITRAIQTEAKERNIIRSLLKLSTESNLTHINFDEFIELLLKEVGHTLAVERVGFWYYREQEKCIELHQQYNLNKKTFSSGDKLYRKDYPQYFEAITTDRTLNADNAHTDPRTIEFTSGYLQDNNIFSLLDTQIRWNGRLLGIICLEKTGEARHWGFSDQRYAASLSDLIANAYTTKLNRRLSQENNKLINVLLSKNKRLEELNYMLYHNIRGPVTGMMGVMNYCQDHPDPEFGQEALRHVRNYSDQLMQIITDLSTILKVYDDTHMKIEQINLFECIDEIGSEINGESISDSIHYRFEPTHAVRVYVPFLKAIVKELLSNSLKFKSPDRPLEIEISIFSEENWEIITFSDNGIGLDLESNKDRLFKIYHRFSTEQPGRGFGLFHARSMAEAMGGKVNMYENEKYGISVALELPVYHDVGKLAWQESI